MGWSTCSGQRLVDGIVYLSGLNNRVYALGDQPD